MNQSLKNNPMKTFRLLCLRLASAAALLLPISAFSQGSLTPPGAPAPTMKRLDEIEPRTNLQATPAPAGVDAGNANYHFIINQPGSYYLSANLAVTKANGIQINAEGVTLNLNGFQVARASGTGGDGIQVAAAAHRFRLLNGSIKGFAFGINTPGSSGARASKYRDLDVSGCTAMAIVSGPGAFIESCYVHDNTGERGFSCTSGTTLINCTAAANTVNIAMHTGVGATVINCTASNNTTGFGIYADAGSTLTNCNALGNIGTDTFSCGISTGTGCTVTASTAVSNWTFNGTPTAYTGIGFYIGAGNTVQGCTAAHNRGDGIGLIGYSLAKGNSSLENGSSGDGAGIHVSSSSNRIEGNNVIGNDRGIDVDGANNIIVSNSAKLNTVNYKIAANNVFGSIVDRTVVTSAAVSGNSAASSAGTVDPWANISY